MNKAQSNEKSVQEPAAIYGVDPQRQVMGIRETVQCIRNGLPIFEFEALHTLLEISAERLGSLMGMSRSTLMRRRKTGHLDMAESDRLLRFARLYRLSVETLGDVDAARNWLNAPARALDMVAPLEFAETETGAREVENLLGRIEHGVFS